MWEKPVQRGGHATDATSTGFTGSGHAVSPDSGTARDSPSNSPLGGLEYRTVLDAVPDGILIVGAHGLIEDVNPRLEDLFGYGRAELLGQPVEMLVPEVSRATHTAHRASYGGEPYTRPMGVGLDLMGRRKDSQQFPVEISLSPLQTDEGSFVIATVRDVRERTRLRDFGVAMLKAAEDERLRLAQELHDDTAQQLSALLLRLRVARDSDEADGRDDVLDQMRAEILSCAEGVRRIARGLRPPELQDVGLVAAIRSHVRALAAAAELHIGVEADPVEDRLGTDAKLVLYRVVQEAVSNVVRHSAAGEAVVRIQPADNGVVVVIEDDGVGFDTNDSVASGRGLGLIGMEERVRSVGGRITLESEPGAGTRVVVVIPEAFEVATHG